MGKKKIASNVNDIIFSEIDLKENTLNNNDVVYYSLDVVSDNSSNNSDKSSNNSDKSLNLDDYDLNIEDFEIKNICLDPKYDPNDTKNNSKNENTIEDIDELNNEIDNIIDNDEDMVIHENILEVKESKNINLSQKKNLENLKDNKVSNLYTEESNNNIKLNTSGFFKILEEHNKKESNKLESNKLESNKKLSNFTNTNDIKCINLEQSEQYEKPQIEELQPQNEELQPQIEEPQPQNEQMEQIDQPKIDNLNIVDDKIDEIVDNIISNTEKETIQSNEENNLENNLKNSVDNLKNIETNEKLEIWKDLIDNNNQYSSYNYLQTETQTNNLINLINKTMLYRFYKLAENNNKNIYGYIEDKKILNCTNGTTYKYEVHTRLTNKHIDPPGNYINILIDKDLSIIKCIFLLNSNGYWTIEPLENFVLFKENIYKQKILLAYFIILKILYCNKYYPFNMGNAIQKYRNLTKNINLNIINHINKDNKFKDYINNQLKNVYQQELMIEDLLKIIKEHDINKYYGRILKLKYKYY